MYLLFPPSWCFNNIPIFFSTSKSSTDVFCISICLKGQYHSWITHRFVIHFGMSLVNTERCSPKAHFLWVETDLQWSKRQRGWVLSSANTGADQGENEGLWPEEDCTNTGVTWLFCIYPWRWVVKAHTKPECDDWDQSQEVCSMDVANSQTDFCERRSEVSL